MPDEPEDFTIQQKIAIIMVAMGEDAAGEIVSHLSDDDVEAIAQAITELGAISSERVDAVLEEFDQLLLGGQGLEEGGSDLARSILEKAVGGKKADEVMSHLDEKRSSGFYMLRHADADLLGPTRMSEIEQAQHRIAQVIRDLDAHGEVTVARGGEKDEYVE